jgi:hypothetical protein
MMTNEYFKSAFMIFWTLIEGIMIFRSYKGQNRNFGQVEALNFEGLLRYQKVMYCYDFWIFCEVLNE